MEIFKLKKLTNDDQIISINTNHIICASDALIGEKYKWFGRVSKHSNLFRKIPFLYGTTFQVKNQALIFESKIRAEILTTKTRLYDYGNYLT